MPNWYWEKKELRATPSLQKGLDFKMETIYRKEGVRFIMELGRQMNLSHNTIATGAVYFHRFFMFHAFQEFNRYVVSTCCLVLAGKAEETPKKCNDIIRTVRFKIKNWHNRQSQHKNWWDQFVEDLDTADIEDICHQILDGVTPPDQKESTNMPSVNNVSSPVRMRTPQTSKKSPITRLTLTTTERSPVRKGATPQTQSANVPPPVVKRTTNPQNSLVSAKNVPTLVMKEEVTDVKKREESSTSVSSQVPNHPPVSSQTLQLPNPIQGLNIYNHPPPSYIPNHAPPPPNLMMQMQNQSFDARISPYPSHTSNHHQSTTSTHHGRYHSTHHYHPGYQQNGTFQQQGPHYYHGNYR